MGYSIVKYKGVKVVSGENKNADAGKESSAMSVEGVDTREPWERDPHFSYFKVVLISLGFFATSAAWSLYNSQVPLILNEFFPGQLMLIGFIMTIDNIIGSVLQPVTGNLSDRTRSRFGRRMPYIITGLPVSAVSLVLLAIFDTDEVVFFTVLFVFCTMMAFWRAPVVSLMPDFVAPKDRSKGNAIVNLLGGIGTAIVSLAAGELIDSYGRIYGFVFVAAVMIIAMIVLFFGIKEPDTRQWDFTKLMKSTEKKPNIIEEMKFLLREKEKSPIYMLLAIFFWFLAYQAIEAMLSLYVTQVLGLSQGTALKLLFFVSASFILSALPAGFLAKKITRKRTILIGLFICTANLMFLGFYLRSSDQLVEMIISMVLFGIGWAFININSIAMLWDMARTPKHIGTYTGLYYFASFMAAVIGPIGLGAVLQFVTGLEYLFTVCSFLMIFAILAMLPIKRGEPVSDEEIEKAKMDILGSLDGE